MNIVPWQSQDEKPSAAQKIIFKLLFETPPSPRVPGPWWSELFGQRHQRDLGLKLLCPIAGIDSSRVAGCFSLISFRFRCQLTFLAYLGVNNNPDHCAVFLHPVKILVQLFLSRLILPFLAVLGEGLLLALVPEAGKSEPETQCRSGVADTRRGHGRLHTPVFIKSALALITEMLRKDGFERAKAMDRLDVSHNPDYNDRRGFDDGDRFHFLSL